jgi:hypothetical protein
MTDRDHFAAAALTGLLSDKANQYPTALQWEHLLKHAYRWADAMLRERERTGNQTAPPCVETDGSSSAIAQPPASSDGSGEGRPLDGTRPDTKGEATGGRGRNTSGANGDTSAKPVAESQDQQQEPVAWAVYKSDGEPYDVFFSDPACDAERMRGEWMAISGATFVPLYRTPQTCPYVVGRTTQHCSLTPFTLTDEEREAVRFFSKIDGPHNVPVANKRAATLRVLLERLG